MRSVNWGSVEASSEGGFARIEPGAYAGVITSVEDVPSKEYVRVLFDIADGPHKGYYSDGFYADKPWAHSVIMSYKDSALGMLKGRLETIQACNPGFDPFAAWDAGRLDMFAGRKVGLVFREEEYWDKKTEEFRLGSARCYRFCRLDEVATIAAPKPKMLGDDEKVQALVRAGYGQLDAQAMVEGMRAGAKVSREAATDDYSDVPFV
ncbi:hypothetical protein [Thermophilibacter sp.]